MTSPEHSSEDPKAVTEAEWRERLSAEQFHILREAGTERAFSGKYDKFYEAGEYMCAACGTRLFISAAKYNSGCGWPAFTRPADDVAFLDLPVFAEDHDADIVAFQVQRHALDGAGELDELARLDADKAARVGRMLYHLADEVAEELQQPFSRISLEMVYASAP